MKFKSVAEAFNFYRTKSIEEMETRAQAINNTVDTDANADIEALNIELRGIKEAKENAELRSAGTSLNLITGMDTAKAGEQVITGDVIDSPEYRNAFMKSLLGTELTSAERTAWNKAQTEKRADAFSAATDATAVLPTNTLNQVISKARKIGGLLSECRAFTMPTNIAIPVGTPGTKAAWHTEGAAVDSEKVVPATVTFGGHEIMKVFSISAKVRKMSISAFESYLTDELAACVMETIADSIVNGTGANQGTGLEAITWTSANSVDVATDKELTYKDVVSAAALLKRGYSAGAKIAMNNATLYTDFYGMTDTTGRPVFIANPKNEGIGKILGFDVVIDDNIADHDIYLGNFAQYMGYNLPQGIAIEASTQSSFKKGLIDYRAMAIADTKPIIEEAFVKITKATA